MGEATDSRRVLITGSSGFIGTNVVGLYRKNGCELLGYDAAPPRDPQHRGSWRQGDVLDLASLRATFTEFRPTHVLHLAARTDLRSSRLSEYASNTTGVENIIRAVGETSSVQRVIFASSRMVCRIGYQPGHDEDYCPPNAYGESKVVGEQIVRKAELRCSWSIVRPTSIWGPWFATPYKDFFLSIARGRYVHVRGRSATKAFGYVGNTVHQLTQLAEAPGEDLSGRTFYLADYAAIDVRDMAERIRHHLGARKIPTVPLTPVRAAAVAGDWMRRCGWSDPPLTRFRLENLLTDMVFDLSPLREVVNALPYSLDGGIARTVRWLRDQGEI